MSYILSNLHESFAEARLAEVTRLMSDLNIKYAEEPDIEKELPGKTLEAWIICDMEKLLLCFTDGSWYFFYHDQGCCENVNIEDLSGDFSDLLGSPLTLAEIASNSTDNPPRANAESFTWTFYKFAVAGSYVTVRWLGESNGYYSERVDARKVK